MYYSERTLSETEVDVEIAPEMPKIIERLDFLGIVTLPEPNMEPII